MRYDHFMAITAEEKLLRLLIKDQSEDPDFPVRQETPACPVCRKPVDIADFSVKVDFRDIKVGGETVTIADPYCPRCGVKIAAMPCINH